MESFDIIPATKSTPAVELNTTNKEFSLKGRSIVIDANEFYGSVVSWVQRNIHEMDGYTFVFYIPYLNSASVKSISLLIRAIKSELDKGKDVKIDWWVDEDDDTMRESGEYFSDIYQIPINIVDIV